MALLLLLSVAVSCVPIPGAPAPQGAATPSADRLVIYAPATPASIPILLAARDLEDAEVTIFTNHSQANAQFLRGDVDILVTGLSVGVEMFRNGAPVQVVNSYVAGMTYLVTYGRKIDRFADLKGGSIYLPFEGSPIEETTRYFAEREGLAWKNDITPIYAPFTSSVELLKQGRAAAVALPEPSVSLIAGDPNLHISLSYRALWDASTGTSRGYPQVTPFVRGEWAAAHRNLIARFNRAVDDAIREMAENPATAVAQTVEVFPGVTGETLAAALTRTDFAFTSGDVLAEEIAAYYRTVGKPIDATFNAFFYRDQE